MRGGEEIERKKERDREGREIEKSDEGDIDE